MRAPDHLHAFDDKKDKTHPSLYVNGMVRVYCYEDDCYKGLDRQMYPPSLIGPKLYLRAGKP